LGVAAVLAFIGPGGCGMSRQAQLEAVAKDWCMTIRASQVIPVYPLTADLQPGDIFLVQTPIENQVDIYRKRGFLPLDNHLARLHPTGYAPFYDHSFLDPAHAPQAVLPAAWTRSAQDRKAWALAPTAAFPSYSFTVESGAGLNLAVPVKGIPVGLTLLGARSANGSVSIQRAKVIGIDIVSLYTDLQAWASANQDFLRAFAADPRKKSAKSYLRVVTRVYATGQVEVALSDARSFGGGADVGQPRPVELVLPKAPETLGESNASAIANYRESLESLNQMLAQSGGTPGPDGLIPGGSVRITAASSRFIALQQEFDPPLVIGYLGFDCEIWPDGVIGPPIPTHAVVDPDSQGDPFRSSSVVRALYGDGLPTRDYERLRDASSSSPSARAAVSRLDALARHVPAAMVVFEARDDGGLSAHEDDFGERNYLAFEAWYAALQSNIVELRSRLERGESIAVQRGNALVVVSPGTTEWRDLERALAEARGRRADGGIASERAQACQFAGAEVLRQLSQSRSPGMN